MRTFMQWSISAGCLALTFGIFADGRVLSASDRGLQLAQVQMQPIAPQNPSTPQRGSGSLEAKPNIPTTEQENKQLKERVAKQDAEIQKLNTELKRYTALSQNQTHQIQQLTKQIAEFTQKGGRQVRAYCEGNTISRNTAGVVRNCAQFGYQCEPVSGLCRDRCSATAECADGYVCTVPYCSTPR